MTGARPSAPKRADPWSGFIVTAWSGQTVIGAKCLATGRRIAKRRGPGWYVDPMGACIPVETVAEARRVASLPAPRAEVGR